MVDLESEGQEMRCLVGLLAELAARKGDAPLHLHLELRHDRVENKCHHPGAEDARGMPRI